jgi:tetratricopeptide (TPR) repeat protein
VPEPAPPGAGSDAPRLIANPGAIAYPITTPSPTAQRYFDQGLALVFGFNHDAAIRSFAAAEELDPECAMCAWGIALASGPNINWPMGPASGRTAFAAAGRASQRAAQATEKEQALIAAVATRYAEDPTADRAPLDLAYAGAMREVQARYPDDDEIATLSAEALMDLMPWNYWTPEAEPREHTPQVLEYLEGVLARTPGHIGANHYYIHATEEFFPERGEAAADRLAALGVEQGHLVHMPSHIFWRVGRYEDALEINQAAAAQDEEFFSWCRAGAVYRSLYYPHNVHFLWAAAAAEGRSEIALTAARKLEAVTADGVEEFAFMEDFMVIPMLTLARFGRWDALLGTPAPDPAHRYLTGVWHYTRGLALVRTGALADAQKQLDAAAGIAAEAAMADLVLAGGVAQAGQLLAIGVAHLEGELAVAAGRGADALAALGRAVERQDALAYMEPPPWYFPTRQALGAVLLDLGRAAEAEAVYRRDLEQYPKNGWSLFGLARSFEAQSRAVDAQWAGKGFRAAWARADVTLESSRF